jgi:hypothetical protein
MTFAPFRNPKFKQPLVLLGQQLESPRVQDVLAEWQIRGPVGLVSAGWEEDEEDDQWVRDALDVPVVNSHLYGLADRLFQDDPEVLRLLRERQDRLRDLREINAWQTENLFALARELWQRIEENAAAVGPFHQTMAHLREVDRTYLRSVSTVIKEYDQRIAPQVRPSLQAYRSAVLQRLDGCQALLIAGGHVGVLLNRLNLCRLLRHVSLPIIAWSGGAMALGERVFFYDHFIPHAKKEVELSRQGLRMYVGLQVFPRAEERLNLQDHNELALLARRIEAPCLLLESNSEIRWNSDGTLQTVNVRVADANGGVKPWQP